MADVTVFVCESCGSGKSSRRERERSGRSLFDALNSEDLDVAHCRVAAVDCLGACDMPCSAVVSKDSGYSWLFGNLPGRDAAADLAAFARRVARAPSGWVDHRDRPAILRRALLGRVPPRDGND